MKRNLAASVRARLKQHADTTGQDFNLTLTHYGLERLLYRLSLSEHATNFLLKGALLFNLWYDIAHRPTRDVDFLGFGPDDVTTAVRTFRRMCPPPPRLTACSLSPPFQGATPAARRSRFRGVPGRGCAALAGAKDSSLLIPHSYDLTPHSSPLTPHSSLSTVWRCAVPAVAITFFRIPWLKTPCPYPHTGRSRRFTSSVLLR